MSDYNRTALASDITRLVKLTVDLQFREDTLIVNRLLKLVDVLKQYFNLILTTDGRKTKKFKEFQSILHAAIPNTVMTVVDSTNALMEEIKICSFKDVFASNNLLGRYNTQSLRDKYKYILSLIENLSISVIMLEG